MSDITVSVFQSMFMSLMLGKEIKEIRCVTVRRDGEKKKGWAVEFMDGSKSGYIEGAESSLQEIDMDKNLNEYKPDSVSPPGETIMELFAEEWPQWDYCKWAEMLGLKFQSMGDLERGDMRIDKELALKLEKALDVPAIFWLKRERDYLRYLRRTGEEK